MGRFVKALVRLLSLLLAVCLFASCGGGAPEKPTTPVTPEVETFPPPTEEPSSTPEPSVIDLVFLSYSSYMNYGSYVSWLSGKHYKGDFLHIIGELQNPSSVNVRLDMDKIEATFYDASGSVIDPGLVLKHRFIEEAILAPGEKWPFRLIVLDEEASKKVTSYELVAQGTKTTDVPHEIEVLSYRLSQNANLELMGEVKNTTDENINVTLIATFYDEKGTVIAADTFSPLIVLGPDEKAPFSLLPVPKEAPGEVKTCELLTRWSVSDRPPYREFEILNVVYQEGPEWSWRHHTLAGEVKNSGEQTVTSIYVYVTYYGGEGEVIECSPSSVEPETLQPGDKGSFELIAPPPPWQMPNYALLVKGRPLGKE